MTFWPFQFRSEGNANGTKCKENGEPHNVSPIPLPENQTKRISSSFFLTTQQAIFTLIGNNTTLIQTKHKTWTTQPLQILRNSVWALLRTRLLVVVVVVVESGRVWTQKYWLWYSRDFQLRKGSECCLWFASRLRRVCMVLIVGLRLTSINGVARWTVRASKLTRPYGSLCGGLEGLCAASLLSRLAILASLMLPTGMNNNCVFVCVFLVSQGIACKVIKQNAKLVWISFFIGSREKKIEWCYELTFKFFVTNHKRY